MSSSSTFLAAGQEQRQPKQSLVQICRDIVVTHLERYPPPAFAILDEHEWESIIKLKHEKTRPKTGFRVAPAVTDKFLGQVEENCPFLAESDVADDLVWKDCVGHKFKEGGLTRPKGLLYPWPVLVAMLRQSANTLLELVRKTGPCSAEDRKNAIEAINTLSESPMNVPLLEATKVGKSVKSFLKALPAREECFLFLNHPSATGKSQSRQSHRDRLSSAFDSWVSIAANSGVKMKPGVAAGPTDSDKKRDQDSLKLAEECQSWRQLFCTLKDFDSKFREDQGLKMRERRLRLDKVRPKIVKVRPTPQRHDNILSRSVQRLASAASSTSVSPSKSKIQQLRAEATIQSSRRVTSAPVKLRPTGSGGGGNSGGGESGFGAAVAFASLGGAGSKKRKAASTTTVSLGQGKRMKVPDAKRSGQNLKKRMGLMKNLKHGPPPKR